LLLLLLPPLATELKTDNLITGSRFLNKSLLESFPRSSQHSLRKVQVGVVQGGAWKLREGLAVRGIELNGCGFVERETCYLGVVEDIGLLVNWTALVLPVAVGPGVDFVRVSGSLHQIL
jgi:hypothetical protein